MTEKEQLWYSRYLNFIESGLSQRQWCNESHLSASSFAYWIKKFSARDKVSEGKKTLNSWYEVQEVPAASDGYAETAIEVSTIRIADGDLKIELPSTINPTLLLRLVEGLHNK